MLDALFYSCFQGGLLRRCTNPAGGVDGRMVSLCCLAVHLLGRPEDFIRMSSRLSGPQLTEGTLRRPEEGATLNSLLLFVFLFFFNFFFFI